MITQRKVEETYTLHNGINLRLTAYCRVIRSSNRPGSRIVRATPEWHVRIALDVAAGSPIESDLLHLDSTSRRTDITRLVSALRGRMGFDDTNILLLTQAIRDDAVLNPLEEASE